MTITRDHEELLKRATFDMLTKDLGLSIEKNVKLSVDIDALTHFVYSKMLRAYAQGYKEGKEERDAPK